MLRLTIVNISSTIKNPEFHAAMAAIRRQVKEDFEPEWNVPTAVRGVTKVLKRSQAPIEGVHDAILYVGDAAEDPTTGVSGALGYHSTNHKNIPYGFVYLDICAQYGEVWTCTLSHEVLELLADPTAMMTIAGPDPRDAKRNVRFDLEVCDPTQGDTYTIDDVVVSNFVTKAYFGMVGGSANTNFLNLSLKPFGVRPNGYFQFEDAHGTHQIQGKKAEAQAEKRKSARAKMGMGRRNTRREALGAFKTAKR